PRHGTAAPRGAGRRPRPPHLPPVRALSAHPPGDPRRRGPARQRDKPAMSRVAHLNRRSFLASVAAVGGSLALGFEIPFGPRAVHASSAPRDGTARIVTAPAPTVVVTVA